MVPPAVQGEGGSEKNQARILINEVFYSENFCVWFEVYNPTNRTIDTQGWLVWFYSINGPIHLPQMNILPEEYVVICPNEKLVREQWDLPSDVRVFEMDFGARYDRISISTGLWENSKGIDAVPDDFKFPVVESGHSWARYAGGHDTGNFANDFYDEPHPTPGRSNDEHPDEHPPLLATGSVSPASGSVGTTFAFQVTYVDPDNDAASQVEVYIDNAAHDMAKISGDYTTGAVYQCTWTTTSADVGDYEYYFEAGDGTYTVWLPESDSYLGPAVTEAGGGGNENLTYAIAVVIVSVAVCCVAYAIRKRLS